MIRRFDIADVYIEGPLADLIDHLQKLRSEFEAKGVTDITIKADDTYGTAEENGEFCAATLYGRREETESERKLREQVEEAKRTRRKDLYLKLKKEFE